MPDKTEQIKKYYDHRTPWHDWYMSYESVEQTEKLLGAIIRLFEREIVGKDVLEIACGTGNWAPVLASRAKTVTAIDSSPASIEIATRKNFKLSNVRFIVDDAYSLKEVSKKFNAAFAGDWISHIPRNLLGKFFDVLHSRLEYDSPVIIVEIAKPDYIDNKDVCYDEQNDRYEKRIIPDGSEYKILKNYYTATELEKLLTGKSNNFRYYRNVYLNRSVTLYNTII